MTTRYDTSDLPTDYYGHLKPSVEAFRRLGGVPNPNVPDRIVLDGEIFIIRFYDPVQLRIWQILGGRAEHLTQRQVMNVLEQSDPRFVAWLYEDIQRTGIIGLWRA